MSRATYEEVCKATYAEMSPENIQKFGLEVCIQRYRRVKEEMGWPGDEIYKEARRRMLAHIEELRKKEAALESKS